MKALVTRLEEGDRFVHKKLQDNVTCVLSVKTFSCFSIVNENKSLRSSPKIKDSSH